MGRRKKTAAAKQDVTGKAMEEKREEEKGREGNSSGVGKEDTVWQQKEETGGSGDPQREQVFNSSISYTCVTCLQLLNSYNSHGPGMNEGRKSAARFIFRLISRL